MFFYQPKLLFGGIKVALKKNRSGNHQNTADIADKQLGNLLKKQAVVYHYGKPEMISAVGNHKGS